MQKGKKRQLLGQIKHEAPRSTLKSGDKVSGCVQSDCWEEQAPRGAGKILQHSNSNVGCRLLQSLILQGREAANIFMALWRHISLCSILFSLYLNSPSVCPLDTVMQKSANSFESLVSVLHLLGQCCLLRLTPRDQIARTNKSNNQSSNTSNFARAPSGGCLACGFWLTQCEQMSINAKGHFVPLTLCVKGFSPLLI